MMAAEGGRITQEIRPAGTVSFYGNPKHTVAAHNSAITRVRGGAATMTQLSAALRKPHGWLIPVKLE
jgi:hypothetical protein